MVNGVQFDEDQPGQLIIPRAHSTTMGDSLIRLGLAATPGSAMVILAVFAFLLITGSIYFIASAVPPPAVLGHDILRTGETVPDYVR